MRCVFVLTGEHAVAARNERDLCAKVCVSRCELGTGDSRADHDEVFRNLGEVVQLGPRQNARAIGLGGGKGSRAGSDGDDDGIGVKRVKILAGCSWCFRDDAVRPIEATLTSDNGDTRRLQRRGHVRAGFLGKPKKPFVDGAEVDGDGGATRTRVLTLDKKLHTEFRRLPNRDGSIRGRDEGLRWNDVG